MSNSFTVNQGKNNVLVDSEPASVEVIVRGLLYEGALLIDLSALLANLSAAVDDTVTMTAEADGAIIGVTFSGE